MQDLGRSCRSPSNDGQYTYGWRLGFSVFNPSACAAFKRPLSAATRVSVGRLLSKSTWLRCKAQARCTASWAAVPFFDNHLAGWLAASLDGHPMLVFKSRQVLRRFFGAGADSARPMQSGDYLLLQRHCLRHGFRFGLRLCFPLDVAQSPLQDARQFILVWTQSPRQF